MSKQYGKHIFNKVTFVCYNFNIDFRVDADAEVRLDWRSTNAYYPLDCGVYYDKIEYAAKFGFYVKIVRIKFQSDKEIAFHDTSNVHRFHVYPFSFPGARRRYVSTCPQVCIFLAVKKLLGLVLII